MTPNLLDELEKIVALSEKATPGPWHWVNPETDMPRQPGEWRASLRTVEEFPAASLPMTLPKFIVNADEICDEDMDANADLIAACVNFLRTHAPALADMAKRMEAAERDAARYRWLRDKAWSMPAIAQQELPAVAIFSGSGRRCKDVSGEEMDAAIDAAIDATQEGEG